MLLMSSYNIATKENKMVKKINKKEIVQRTPAIDGKIVNMLVSSSGVIRGIAHVYIAIDNGQYLELGVCPERQLKTREMTAAQYLEVTQRLIHYAANAARKEYDGLEGVSYGTNMKGGIENGR